MFQLKYLLVFTTAFTAGIPLRRQRVSAEIFKLFGLFPSCSKTPAAFNVIFWQGSL